MSDTQTTITPDLLTALQAQLAATQKPIIGWGTKTTTATPQGIAVPIKVGTPKGEIRLYLQFPQECASSPEAVIQLLQALDSQGYPLDIWQPKGSGWGSGEGWSRSSYSRNGWRR